MLDQEKKSVSTENLTEEEPLTEKMKEMTEQATRKVRNFHRKYFQQMEEKLKRQKKLWAK